MPALMRVSWSNPGWSAGNSAPRVFVTEGPVGFITSVLFVVHPIQPWPVLKTALACPASGWGPRTQETLRNLGQLVLKRAPSPIKTVVLDKWLQLYPDQEATFYILEGFRFGFRIPVLGARTASMFSNLKSIQGLEVVVKEKIKKEVQADWQTGRVLGLFKEPLDRHISLLGILPKKTGREYRLIHHHLSYPEGD